MASIGAASAYGRMIATAGHAAEIAGVAAILIGSLAAGVMALKDLRRGPASAAFRSLRQRLGRAILLGLELLVAADIIGTVTEDPNLASVVVLGVIVLIRTFLSFTLELEISGRWPWQQRDEPAGDRRAFAASSTERHAGGGTGPPPG